MLLLLRLCVAPLPKILSASRTFQIITFYWESFKNVGININALDVHFFSDVILVIRYIPTKWNHIHTYTENFSSHIVDKTHFGTRCELAVVWKTFGILAGRQIRRHTTTRLSAGKLRCHLRWRRFPALIFFWGKLS